MHPPSPRILGVPEVEVGIRVRVRVNVALYDVSTMGRLYPYGGKATSGCQASVRLWVLVTPPL